MNKSIRNIALFAHVDAGKTTITEQFLFLSGKIRELGSVDKGNSQTDNLQVEKERGITVNSTVLTFDWDNTQINLIDTPGHIDFSSETEKAIMAIDAAVVIISASEGVQAQTENMVQLLKNHKKPFIIFINKIDRIGANTDDVIQEIEKDLNVNVFKTQNTINESNDDADIETIWSVNNFKNETSLIEKIVENNDNLFEQYLDGNIPDWEILNDELKKNIFNIVPVLFGSAKKTLGIKELLNAIIAFLPNPKINSEELSGIVFKTYHKKADGKICAVRLFGGTINSRSEINNASKKLIEKISLIKNTDIQNQKIIQSFSAGEIAWVQGLKSAEPGDLLGNKILDIENKEKTQSLLTVQIIPKDKAKINALIDAMQILNNEDPDLKLSYLKEESELHINIRGEIQKEILEAILKSRFDIEVEFSEPSVIYKETPTISCEGFVRYWLPKPCWAIMKFKIEPGEQGSGVEYKSIVSVNDIKKQYQKDVEKTIPTALQQGILAWQVDDIKITLIEGEDHEVHTKSNDFAIATPMGIMEGLSKSKPTLLEPILSFKLVAPEEYLGTLISELLKLRAKLDKQEISNSTCKITGEIPLATSLNFPIKLSSLTSGKGKIITKFLSYQKCDNELGKTREYKGISPLDTAKYILKARKALS